MWKRAPKSNEKTYHRVRLAPVSGNCEFAAADYFRLIAPLCPAKEDIAHSLLRLAMRPVFYLPIADFENLLEIIMYINKDRPSFLKWLNENRDMIDLIFKELTICLFFYDLRYDDEKKIVILDHKVDEEMAYLFVEIPDRNIYKEFLSFDDFKEYYHSFFNAYGIGKEEIDRLILEEGYEVNFFSNMTKEN
ncbi:MAG: hypothetical protein FWC74_10275 [Candidatus Bathyarchaeota archaeon]|nr:hypothetical protein [Candidatus Termitimicrobium sp.]